MTTYNRFTCIAYITLLLIPAVVHAESPLVKLTSRALAAEYAGLASPTIALATPTEGQPYAEGEKATVSWHYTGISKKKKLNVALLNAKGKSIRKVRIRADRSYSFTITKKLASKLSKVEVCIPRQGKFSRICDSRAVTVLETQPSPGTEIGVNPKTIGFVTLTDVEPPSQILEISSSTHGAGYSIEAEVPWLSVTPNSGAVPGSATLAARVAGLAPGTYKTILKASASGSNSATNIPVSLEILKPSAKAPLTLEFSAKSLGLDISSGASPETRQVNILTSNGASVPFQASSNTNWLTVSPSNGTTVAGLTIAANPSGLAVGTYNGEISAQADGFEPVKLRVTLRVNAPVIPALLLNTSELNFAAPSGTSPAVQNIQLSTNTGVATAFSLDEAAPWLSVLPAGTQSPSTITLAANGAGLLPGNYSATLTAQAAGFQPVAIPVRFTVTAPGAGTLFSEDFADGNADGWTIGNDTVNPAAWQVSDGAYRQANMVGLAADTVHQAHNLGSFAVANATAEMQDYQFSVTATPTSVFDLDIGVMFRYRDPSNYYRLSIGNGFARLERRLTGNFTTLTGNARGYLRGVPQTISISVQGPLIQVSVNGERLLSARDANFSTGGIALYCRDDCSFDDVQVRPLSPDPTIAVSKPEAHTVVSKTSVDVSAVVINHPGASADVEFSLTGLPGACGQATESAAGLFSAQCSIPADGSVSNVVASLKVGGAIVDLDSSERVGYGSQIIAVGDSITYGLEDSEGQDNQDPGGWVISGGYSSVLTKLLNQNGGLPAMVYNNGIPGLRSNELAFIHLDDILLRHKDAQYVLLGIGTNDAGTNVSDATFQSNMQRMINNIRAAGKTPIVPLIPPRFGAEAAKNFRVIGDATHIGYNNIIPQLDDLATQTKIRLGPNFYSELDGRQDLFADDLHPNGAGYSLMGELWNASLGSLP